MAEPTQAAQTNLDLSRILDVEVEMVVELGRTRMRVDQVLELKATSTVEFEKSVGAPLDVCINGRLVARGEPVLIGDKFGLRITEVLGSPDAVGGNAQ